MDYPALLTAIADAHHQPNAPPTKTNADPVFWSGFDEGVRWLTDLGLLLPTLPPSAPAFWQLFVGLLWLQN